MTNDAASPASEQPSPQKLGKAAGEALVAAATAMRESALFRRSHLHPGTVLQVLQWAYPNGLPDECPESGRQPLEAHDD